LGKIFPNRWPFISTGPSNISPIWRGWRQKENDNDFVNGHMIFNKPSLWKSIINDSRFYCSLIRVYFKKKCEK
jgi:hypothetical protein